MQSKTPPSKQLVRQSPEFLAWIVAELAKTAILFGQEVSRERLALTAQEISDLSRDELARAFASVRRNSRFFPTPADIRQAVPLRTVYVNDRH